MILLRDPALIFLKPHKVAGTSFEIALSRFAGADDIITPFGRLGRADEQARLAQGSGPRNYRYPWHQLPFLPMSIWRFARARGQWPKKFRPHISAAEAQAALTQTTWNESVKISITRSPFDTAVSTYFWSRRADESFDSFFQRNPHLIARNDAQYCIGGRNVIDIYLRYDRLADDIAKLESRFPQLSGLGATFAGQSAKSGHRPINSSARELFAQAPAVRKLVECDCRFEIERFGYHID